MSIIASIIFVICVLVLLIGLVDLILFVAGMNNTKTFRPVLVVFPATYVVTYFTFIY